MVYISSNAISTANRQSVMQAQSSLATAQQELSSGTLADAGLTLGARSGQLVSLQQQQAQLQSITDANTLASTRLSTTSTALDTIRTAASGFLSTLTGAQTSGSDTTKLPEAALSALSAFTSALNTTVAGQYVFAGINTDAAPLTAYSQSPASSTKQAVDDAFSGQFGTSQSSSDAGSIDGASMQSFLDSTFSSLFDPASFEGTWSSASDTVISSQISPSQSAATSVSANQSAFRSLAQAYTMVSEFTGSNLSTDAKQAVIAKAASLVSSAINGLTDLEANVGSAQSAVTDASSSMAAQISLLSTQAGSLNGVDSYALSTKISSLQTQVEASYELTAKLQQMSLVNYLS